MLLSFGDQGGIESSEDTIRGHFDSVVTAGVGIKGSEGSRGSSITSCLTETSFLTLFFLIKGLGISGDAAGLGLAGGALGS